MAYIGKDPRAQDFRGRTAHYSQGGTPADRPEAPRCSAPPPPGSPLDILGGLAGGIDSDRLLIAALLLLLMKEGGDKRLILALGYILF